MFNRSSKEIFDKNGEIVDFDDTPFTDDNKVYTEILLPPEGYELEKAVCTTYTLDFRAYLAVLMAFAGDNTDYNDNGPLEEQILAVEDNAKKITVFYDVGHARNADKIGIVKSLLSSKNIKQISLPKPKEDKRIPAFHPKVWLLKYTKGKSAKFKFIVLSRNLSFDTSWDTFIVFNGKKGRNKNTDAVVKLLEHLKIAEDWEDVKGVGFSLEGNENAEIIPLINGKKNEFTFGGDYENAVIMSPFVNKGFFNDVLTVRSTNKPTLITREPVKLNKENGEKFNIYKLKPGLEGQNKDGNIQETGIHAKIYLFDKAEGGSDLYIGSANATKAAFSENTEVLVKIPNLEYTCDKFLQEIHLNDYPEWFSPVAYTETEEAASDIANDRLRVICALKWEGTLSDKNDKIILTINVPEDCPKDGSVIIENIPIQEKTETVKFEYDKASDISEFFNVEVDSCKGMLQIKITNKECFQNKIEESVSKEFDKDAFLQRYFADDADRKRLLKKLKNDSQTQEEPEHPEQEKLKAYSANGHTNFSYEDMLLCAFEKRDKFLKLEENDIFKKDNLITQIQDCLKGGKK